MIEETPATSAAIIRFTRQRSDDDEVVLAGMPDDAARSAPIGRDAYWRQLVAELAESGLPHHDARLLHFEDQDGPQSDVYVMYGIVPATHDDPVAFARQLQTEAYDTGMAGMFQIVAMVSAPGSALVHPGSKV